MGVRHYLLRILHGLVGCLLSIYVLSYPCKAATILQAVDIVADTLPSFSTEITDPKYIIALDVSRLTSDRDEEGGRLMAMTDKNGRQFSCLIPDIIFDDEEEMNGAAKSLEPAAGGAQKSPSELMSVLDSLCMYRIEDWWTYELCYKKHVRQFHKEQDKIVAEFSLGVYSDEDSNMDEILDNGSAGGLKYVSQVYKGGEPCDITGKPRETEVRYVCGEAGKDAITGLREHATCQYILTFSSPRLCGHAAYQTPEPPVHQVLCTLGTESAAAEPAGRGGPDGEVVPPADGGGDAAVAEEEGATKMGEDLGQATTEAGEGSGGNVSAVETAEGAAGQGAASPAAQEIEDVEEGVSQGEPAKAEKDSGTAAAVGPPAPPERDPEEEVFYYDEDNQEEYEDFDEHAFTRSGIHAEL